MRAGIVWRPALPDYSRTHLSPLATLTGHMPLATATIPAQLLRDAPVTETRLLFICVFHEPWMEPTAQVNSHALGLVERDGSSVSRSQNPRSSG